jgi:hypothetical protein
MDRLKPTLARWQYFTTRADAEARLAQQNADDLAHGLKLREDPHVDRHGRQFVLAWGHVRILRADGVIR